MTATAPNLGVAPGESGPPPPGLRPPELIAPAGNWPCVRAAVENGADAIYFGLERHNARLRADNFTPADLPRLMEFLHRRGLRGYVCFNTLIFTEELAEAEQYLRSLMVAGVDAAIVQDVGVVRLIRAISPDFPIHASTQMTITSAAGVAFARELGCNLVVLARECSLREISRLQEELRDGAGTEQGLPLEVFVHGALCVAYSGQCLTSESLGGRSANRGVCAQACRLPYELLSDGQVVPLGDRRYLLSPQDLSALNLLPDLARLGVASLKIEGRLKTPEYVANVTRIYRTVLDQVMRQRSEPGDSKEGAVPAKVDTSAYRYDLEMAFSRGLYSGWLKGINNQELVHGRFGKKRGVFLGTVSKVSQGRVHLVLEAPLKLGDGVVFDAGRPDLEEQGGRIYELLNERQSRQDSVHELGRPVAVGFGRGDVDLSRVRAGDKLWKTSDPELERRWRQSFEGDKPRHQQPVTMVVQGRTGRPLRLSLRDPQGLAIEVQSQLPLTPAQKQPLTDEKLAEQLGRLGGTPLRLGQLVNRLEGRVMLPLSELNRLRRAAVAALEQHRAGSVRWTIRTSSALDALSKPRSGLSRGAEAPAELIVLVRNEPQLEAALRCGVATIYCEFDDPKKYLGAVALARAAGGREVWVAPPRIFKPGEEWILRQVQASGADGYLARNYDHLRFFAGARCVGDYSLNAANPLAAAYFMERYRLERLTVSYDLNAAQIEALIKAAPPDWFEVTVHQHMPMFHMEHCLFCAFLSSGTDYTNCGRPCEKHEVQLRDRVGVKHPVKADAGCRNTVFNGLAQTGAESVPRLLALGVRRFRVEFVQETPGQVEQAITQYRRLLRGEISGGQVWRELKAMSHLGVTRGPE